jgi:hypothetical protein
MIAYLAISSFLRMAMWNGIRRWGGVLGASSAMACAALWISLRPQRSMARMIGYAVSNVMLMALISRMAGPFTFVPALTCVAIMRSMAYPSFTERPVVLLVMIVVGFLAPIWLEHEGHCHRPGTWEIQGGAHDQPCRRAVAARHTNARDADRRERRDDRDRRHPRGAHLPGRSRQAADAAHADEASRQLLPSSN